MSFLIVLFALLLNQARPSYCGRVIRRALRQWAMSVEQHINAGQPHHGVLVWALVVGLPVVVAVAIYGLLSWYSRILGFAWAVAILYVVVELRQLFQNVHHARDLLEQGHFQQAQEHVRSWAPSSMASFPVMSHDQGVAYLLQAMLISAHQRLLAPLVSFVGGYVVGLGPAGVVLYFVVAELASESQQSSMNSKLVGHRLWLMIDYVPARISGLLFAIVGNFEEAIANWRQYAYSSANTNTNTNTSIILSAACGALNIPVFAHLAESGALAQSLGADRLLPQQGLQWAHLSSVTGLIWRSVAVWLLFLLLIALAQMTG
jgi:adenosylcobinamide-phosphate synthase